MWHFIALSLVMIFAEMCFLWNVLFVMLGCVINIGWTTSIICVEVNREEERVKKSSLRVLWECCCLLSSLSKCLLKPYYSCPVVAGFRSSFMEQILLHEWKYLETRAEVPGSTTWMRFNDPWMKDAGDWLSSPHLVLNILYIINK